jgi:hypothetical protein
LGVIALGLIGLAFGCSSDEGENGKPNDGTGGSATGGKPGSGGNTPTGGNMPTGGNTPTGGTGSGGGPNPACPDIDTAPLTDQSRTDSGKLGLAALRRKVQDSRTAFDAYKAAHGNTYTYTRQMDSFTGAYCETTVEVTSGKVTKATERRAEGLEFETRSTISAGGGGGCHPAVTMDALYDECLTKTLCQDPSENYLYVSVDARGLLIECGNFPMNCADDCYEGLEPTILTADGTDWTKPLAGCCEPAAEPDCCMAYGGAGDPANNACWVTCDAMPPPHLPGWGIVLDEKGCVRWREPSNIPPTLCCGCATIPVDGGTD